MKKIFSLQVPNIAQSKLFIVSVLLNAGGSGLVMAFLLVYFNLTTGLSLAAVGFAISLGRAAAMAAPLLIGHLLDRVGARIVAIMGDFITGIGFLLCYWAKDMTGIVLNQIFVQAGAHMFWTSSRGMVCLAAGNEKTQTWFGLVGALRNAGLGAGTLLSAAAFSWDSLPVLHDVVLAAAAFYFASCCALWLWKTEKGEVSAEETGDVTENAPSYKTVMRDKNYAGLLFLNGGLVVSAMVIPLAIVVYVTGQLGMPALFSGFLVVLNTVLVALLGAHVSAWTQDIAPRRNICAGYILNIASFALFGGAAFFVGSPFAAGCILLCAMLLYTAAEMVATPAANVLSVDLAPAKNNGRYMAAFQMTWSVGMVLSPAFFGWLLSHSVYFIWGVLAVIVGFFGIFGLRDFAAQKSKPASRSKNVLVIEPIGMGGALLMESVHKMGYSAIAATTPDVRKTMLGPVEKFIAETVYADFSNLDKAAESLLASDARFHYAGLVTAWEFLTEAGANAAHSLGLRGPDVSKNHARRNKLAMHEAWEAEDCPVPVLQAIIKPEVTDFKNLAASLHFPVIVKPAENSASFGVTPVSSEAELPAAIAAARQWDCEFPHGLPFDKTVLIQEYIPGQEFSVEAVSDSGRFFAWGVTMKFTTEGAARAETGHIFPAPIDTVLKDKILETARRGAAALGITNGISHTEIKLDSAGNPRLIECGPRPAGDYIPKLVALATGQSPTDIYVRQATEGLPDNFLPQKPFRAAAVHFIRPERQGILRDVSFPDITENTEVEEQRIYVPLGNEVRPGSTNIERIGYIMLTSPEASALHRAMENYAGKIKVSIA